MPIVLSEITEREQQPDGRIRTVEIHTDHQGLTYRREYFRDPEWDEYEIMMQRAVLMGAEIDRKIAETAEAMQFTLPISKMEYTFRFSGVELLGIEDRSKTDPDTFKFKLLLEMTDYVYLVHPIVEGSLTYFTAVGILAPGRKEQIQTP